MRNKPQLKPIKGFEDYKIDVNGNVFKPTGEKLTISTDKYGYKTVDFRKNKRSYRKFIHYLLLENFHSPCPPGKETNHKNGIKDDNRLENLEWVTSSENRQHAYDTGLKISVKGEKHGSAKLKNSEVWLIKKLLNESNSKQKDIAKMFKISRSMITAINNNRYWKCIKYP